ncbi:hypothetical protein HH310_12385 [Actinoplanes sp. TBRC 11911]|uniref:DUF6011 domain-containing protein n=1 Tax=Actinoplanes sp. TBRC 11911 TaxID=2729386 RepID=UPI00145DBE7C|nr:DUF6011 domain-containing protein [Actinoplanes sp. TBRC 11911]NMO51991.1 hypothetical protein [Actinoplanes sp. TBRC 11911]
MTGPAADDELVECDKCHRKLRSAESRRRGRGRACDEKVNPRKGRDHSPQGSTRRAAGTPDMPSLLDELEVQP